MMAFLSGVRIWLIPCKTALVTVEREKNMIAEEPYIIILIASALSDPLNSRLQIGAANTLRPTADGIAIIMEKRITRDTLLFICLLFRSATALDSDGIRADAKEFEIATGILNKRRYLPEYPGEAPPEYQAQG